ncbi:Crp/Fnr family transcriptional regulator [Acetivibrio straminisolvens]|uniref:Transcriptional regulator n=1 Tax=Acetivibrio straminisolvens JCM 21531 TaxID=1294263 RepID=W4V1R3_9FIRM|nr:Crp/Fnr family transcriptional regulator [Acetivibrio straminisolvens]GAE86748.1 transcriptional regulator [Acetivibrio straminisolvens JCM 21531]
MKDVSIKLRKRVPIFSTLNAEEINRVVNLIIRKQYSRGEMIILEGSPLNSLIIINSGKVKAFRDTFEGKEQILYIFSQGDFFGEKNLLINQNAQYSVEALEETHACTIKKDDFKKLLREYSEIGLKIIEELCNRLERLENAVESMGTKNAEERVNAVLIEFAKKYGKESQNGIIVELPLSREGIANYIGVARETVSRKMNLLQEEGIIEMVGNKKVIIRNIDAL